MMYHMLPLVDYEATSAGFWLFHFPQDNQSSLQMLSSNVLPLAVPGSTIILTDLKDTVKDIWSASCRKLEIQKKMIRAKYWERNIQTQLWSNLGLTWGLEGKISSLSILDQTSQTEEGKESGQATLE